MPRPPVDHFRFFAPFYDHVFGRGVQPPHLLESLALPVSGWLLDAGGGTGRVSASVREQTGGVVIVDASRGMLQQAGQKDGLCPTLALAERLPFPDGQFERILIVDAFHHFHHQERAARELWRVLKPGGRLVLHEPNIARFAVKLIALGEKLLLMRSRFYGAEALRGIFAALPDAQVAVTTDDDPFYILLIAEKTA